MRADSQLPTVFRAFGQEISTNTCIILLSFVWLILYRKIFCRIFEEVFCSSINFQGPQELELCHINIYVWVVCAMGFAGSTLFIEMLKSATVVPSGSLLWEKSGKFYEEFLLFLCTTVDYWEFFYCFYVQWLITEKFSLVLCTFLVNWYCSNKATFVEIYLDIHPTFLCQCWK